MQRDVDQRYATWMEFSHDLAQAYRNRKLAPTASSCPSEKFERLRAFRFFREFSDVEIWEIVRLSEWRSLEVGTVVMKEGEPGNYFCVLVEGRLRVLKQGHLLNTLARRLLRRDGPVRRRPRRPHLVRRGHQRSPHPHHPRPSLLRASAVCQMHFYKGFLEVLATRLSVANSRIASV
jgi:CRP-like cAMP-binding protein